MSQLNSPLVHILQKQDGECLVACAAMVLQYVGVYITYRRVAKILGTIPFVGTPSSNIRNLTQLGLQVAYKTGDLTILRQQIAIDQPCIAFVNTKELPYWQYATPHAIVIVGIDDASIYLHDPFFAYAPLQTPIGDFDLAWLERDEMYAVITR